MRAIGTLAGMRVTWLMGLALLGTSCVTQKTYDALQHDRDGLEVTLTERNASIRELEEKVAALSKVKTDSAAEIAAQKERIAELETRVTQLRFDIANTSKDKTRMQSSLEEMSRALSELDRRRAEAEARIAEYKNLMQRFRGLIDAGKLKVRIVDGRMVVVLANDILFSSGSAALSKEGSAAIAEVTQVLSSITNRKFQVEGHSDNVPIATAQYPSNWELAAARAITVTKTMIDAGMPAERISAASYGEKQPVAKNDSPEGKAANRRIEITIVPDLSTLPGFDELKKLDKGEQTPTAP